MPRYCFDIEANAADPKEVSRVWCMAIKDIDTEEVWKYGPEEIEAGVRRLQDSNYVIGHNILSYDLVVLERLYGYRLEGKAVDTLILSRLSNPDRRMPWGMDGQKRPHSLEAWGHRFGKPKVEWDKWDEWNPEMLHRCEQDVIINTEVFKALYYEFKE